MQMNNFRMAIAIAALVLGSGTTAHPVEAQENVRAFDTVLRSFGANEMKKYKFNEKPSCPPSSKNPRCSTHAIDELKAVRLAHGNADRNEGYEFQLSPVRDSAGLKVVHVYRTVDPLIRGELGGVENYQFILNRQGTKVLSKKLLNTSSFESKGR